MKMEDQMNELNKNWFRYITIISLFLCSCTNEYCDRLKVTIDEIYNSEQSESIINLREVYNFEWDVLYIFKEYEQPEDISEIIGFDCKCDKVPDLEEMYLFVKDSKIVNISTGECNGYSLKSLIETNLDGGQKIEADKSKFRVVKGQTHYSLTPIE